MGFIPNFEKSSLIPSQEFDYVGYHYNLIIALVTPTQSRIEKILNLLELFLSTPSQTARQWMSLIGLLSSTEKQVPMGRLHLRQIQWHLKRNWSYTECLEIQVPILPKIQTALKWWQDPQHLLLGSPLHQPLPDIQVYTDASNQGWGGHCLHQTAQGLWSEQEKKLHINILEMKAVILCLKRFQNLVANKTCLVASDNSTVVAYLQKQGGVRVWQMNVLS
jgi:hypothetical protein